MFSPSYRLCLPRGDFDIDMVHSNKKNRREMKHYYDRQLKK